jgi:hypothetical protein
MSSAFFHRAMPRINRIVVGAALLAATGAAQAAVVDFNTPGDYAAKFTSEDAVQPFAEADGVGVGGSRGLQMSTTVTDTGSILNSSSLAFNTPGTSLAASVYLHTVATPGTTGEERVLEVNFTTAVTTLTGAHTGAGGKLQFVKPDPSDDVEVEGRRNNADIAGSIPATKFDIQGGRWYKATFTMTNNGTTNPIPGSLVLDDYGTDGLSLVQANVYSHSYDIPIEGTLTADDTVFGGFRVRNATRLYDALDNFEILDVTPVPEPTAVAVLLIGSVALLGRKRRRSA